MKSNTSCIDTILHQETFKTILISVDLMTGSVVNQFNIKDEILKDSSSDSDFSLLSFQI